MQERLAASDAARREPGLPAVFLQTVTEKRDPKLDLLQFRAGELYDKIAVRARDDLSAALVAKRDLTRFYELVDCAEVAELGFTEPEWAFMATVVARRAEPRWLWAEIADDRHRPPGVDAEQLSARLLALAPGYVYAIVDAIERNAYPGGDDLAGAVVTP